METKKRKRKIPPEVSAYMAEISGRGKGGDARAAKHSAEELSKWGKMGGRPKGSGKKQTKKGGK